MLWCIVWWGGRDDTIYPVQDSLLGGSRGTPPLPESGAGRWYPFPCPLLAPLAAVLGSRETAMPTRLS